jgi:hypothetical protein
MLAMMVGRVLLLERHELNAVVQRMVACSRWLIFLIKRVVEAAIVCSQLHQNSPVHERNANNWESSSEFRKHFDTAFSQNADPFLSLSLSLSLSHTHTHTHTHTQKKR